MKPPKTPPLAHLYIYLTDSCNLACRHCWLAPSQTRVGVPQNYLSKSLFQRAIQEAKPLGLQSVKLTGGEPLLHPDFMDLLQILYDEELSPVIETNGVLLTSSVAGKISQFPKRSVSISLDGADAETHEWIRGMPGCFDKTCQAVRSLADAGTPPQIIMTIMKKNFDQVDSVIRMAESLGASSVKFNIVQPTARGKKLHEDELAMDVEDLIELGHRIDKELAPATKLNLLFDVPMAFRSLGNLLTANGCSVCGIFGILGVIASGQYALCGIGEHVPELIFGKVGEDRLEAVWKENEVLQSIRESLPEKLEGICSRCLMKGRCLGACIAQNYYRSKNLWSPYWFCEMAEQQGIFPATRLA